MNVKPTHALRDRKAFATVFKSKTRFFCNFLSVYFVKNNYSSWRLAVSVSKAKYKLAVQRNLIRRQIRAIMRSLDEKLLACDIVVIVNPGFLELTFKEKQALFLQLLKRIEKLNASKPQQEK